MRTSSSIWSRRSSGRRADAKPPRWRNDRKLWLRASSVSVRRCSRTTERGLSRNKRRSWRDSEKSELKETQREEKRKAKEEQARLEREDAERIRAADQAAQAAQTEAIESMARRVGMCSRIAMAPDGSELHTEALRGLQEVCAADLARKKAAAAAMQAESTRTSAQRPPLR